MPTFDWQQSSCAQFWREPEEGGIKHETSGNRLKDNKNRTMSYLQTFSPALHLLALLWGLGRPERSPSFTDRRVSLLSAKVSFPPFPKDRRTTLAWISTHDGTVTVQEMNTLTSQNSQTGFSPTNVFVSSNRDGKCSRRTSWNMKLRVCRGMWCPSILQRWETLD